MFYWFKRGDELTKYEVRTVGPTHFEMTIMGPDGVERVERFDSADALHERQLEFERHLAAHGWSGPHGWNL